ncbi:hypothetical protein ACIPY3_03275 [Paenarthrobacter sp. NPDC089714]|uniref:hypothetical protein n=1 Tax=Paenarthrobacter sp. NPDC089714 TaxID=3364377 RepID=UPI0037FAD410
MTMSREEAAAKKFGELAGGGPTVAIDYEYSGKILAAADAADAAAQVHRIGLDEESLKRTAGRSWDALSKRDMTRNWSQMSGRGQAIWIDNVRNVLQAATEEDQ